MTSLKEHLHHYLGSGREAILWKLEGLSEYDQRRPLVPTGTNLLGLVKHLAAVETGYFTIVFGRPTPPELTWALVDPTQNEDMYAFAEESPEQILHWYRLACTTTDATIHALDLDSPGRVPWWSPASAGTTLGRVLLHMVAETHRHAGHADIVRELIDGSVGLNPRIPNVPDLDAAQWSAYRTRLQAIAQAARDRPGPG